jgi:hypothetical protein
MGMGGGLFCRDCGQSLAPDLLGGPPGTRILAEAYCDPCRRARSLGCRRCGAGLRLEDFEEGRAVTVGGRRVCEACLEEAAEKGRRETTRRYAAEQAPGEPSTEARRHGRYLPGRDAVLALRARGMGGLLRGDRVRVWLDISEGGLRAVLSGAIDAEAALDGSITVEGTGEAWPFEAVVKHVRGAPRHPGCVLAGCAFVDPSPELLAFIRGSLAARPVHLPRVPE